MAAGFEARRSPDPSIDHEKHWVGIANGQIAGFGVLTNMSFINIQRRVLP
jgi:hypothetical protein